MKDWTQNQTLLRTYAAAKWIGQNYQRINYTAAVFASGVYIGIITTQGI